MTCQLQLHSCCHGQDMFCPQCRAHADIDSWCPFYDSISGHAGPASIIKHTLFLSGGTAENWCPAASPAGVQHMLPYQKGHLLCGQAAVSGHCLCEASAGVAAENLPGTGV
jgi:hypothetical protein